MDNSELIGNIQDNLINKYTYKTSKNPNAKLHSKATKKDVLKVARHLDSLGITSYDDDSHYPKSMLTIINDLDNIFEDQEANEKDMF